MNRRTFFNKVAILSAGIFIPQLIKPIWKRTIEPYGVRLIKGLPYNQEAFANFIGPVIKEMLNNQSSTQILFGDWQSYEKYDEGAIYIPLDLYYGPMLKKGLIVDNNI